LGLALVAEHAARIGGEVQIDDRPGGGARFTVSFPADVAS
jgi:signal transduction histidine kinase